jgi:hypothetical protein
MKRLAGVRDFHGNLPRGMVDMYDVMRPLREPIPPRRPQQHPPTTHGLAFLHLLASMSAASGTDLLGPHPDLQHPEADDNGKTVSLPELRAMRDAGLITITHVDPRAIDTEPFVSKTTGRLVDPATMPYILSHRYAITPAGLSLIGKGVKA